MRYSFSLDSVCFFNYYVKSAIHLIKFGSEDVFNDFKLK